MSDSIAASSTAIKADGFTLAYEVELAELAQRYSSIVLVRLLPPPIARAVEIAEAGRGETDSLEVIGYLLELAETHGFQVRSERIQPKTDEWPWDITIVVDHESLEIAIEHGWEIRPGPWDLPTELRRKYA